jgi:hypothetical protein
MDVVMTERKLVWSWLAWMVGISGCASWSPPPAGELSRLPVPNLAPDSVVLEVTFVRIAKDSGRFEDRFWPEVDETVWDAQERRRWASNGFRTGLIGCPPPTVLQEVLDQQSPSELGDGVTTIEPGAELVARSHRLRNRAGNPARVVVRSQQVDRLAALTYDEQGHVRGQSFEQAQCYFSVTSHPLGDGRIRLELAPVIEHGQPRTRFKGQQGAWMLDNTSRPTKVYEELTIETVLSPGQALAVGSTGTHRGLGETFFGADPEQDVPRLLLLVRLQQTQLDDRFVEEVQVDPVASVAD